MMNPTQHLSAPVKFNLAAELETLEAAQPSKLHPRAKALLKSDDLRLVLISLAAGAKLDRHHADGSVSIHVIRGILRVRVQQQEHPLRAGDLLMLPASLQHDVEAMDDAAFLLTISWPPKAKLESLPHRQYA